MARLDRLGTAKEIAQVGAVLGREFSYELLHAVSPVGEDTFQHGLRQLVGAELVYQSGLPPQARYLFKHALVQETAYQSLLKSRRQQLHHQVAQVLEEKFPQAVETQPELVAHHYTEAGLTAQAISYWQKAGQRASQRSAHIEAISHLTNGLELLKTLPDTPERTRQELTLQIALGNQLIATKGYAAPEVEGSFARARELCRQVGETPQLFTVLEGLQVFYLARGQLQTARELAEQSLRLAQSVQDSSFLMVAYGRLGTTLFYLGELSLACEYLEQAITLYDPQKDSPSVTGGGQDLGLACLSYVAWVLWLLGYPERALRRTHEALTLAQELSHPFSFAHTLHLDAIVHQLRREVEAVQEHEETLLVLATEQGLSYWAVQGSVLQGWALAAQGQVQEGIARMRRGLAAYQATGAELTRRYYLLLLCETCREARQVEEGLSYLAEALAVVHRTGVRPEEAELYRLKGELTLQQFKVQGSEFKVSDPQPLIPDPQAEAEACFLKAIEIAQSQKAKSWELRATMSLARLWQHQGKQKEAHQMLAEIYGWFTEGFDTKDLQEAKALLDELS